MIIKAALVLGLLGVALYAFRGRISSSHLAVRRVLAVGVLAVGIAAVLFPSITNQVAQLVGVSRGADLLSYGFVVVSMFVWVGMYRRILEVEAQLVTLARTLALQSANFTSESGNPRGEESE